MKKVLFVATVYQFLNFERSDMNILKSMGYEIHIATNMQESEWLKDNGCLDDVTNHKHQIDFSRSPFSRQSQNAYHQLKKLMSVEHFDLIHCHTPVAAAITRLAAIATRRKGTKVVYTDHGFHFHKSSGIKNWILYYPIEYISSIYTDMIITINQEDYGVIKHFPCKYKRYIPGVGVDVELIQQLRPDSKQLRMKYGIPEDAFMILIVGELSARKNQEVVIKALAKVDNPKVYCLICGTGQEKEHLENLIKELGLEERVLMPGFISHQEVLELGYATDVGVLPSKIEGLGLAGIETMAAGKPVIGSGVHGIKDYVIDNETGFRCNPNDEDAFAGAIIKLMDDKELYKTCSHNASIKAREFDIRHVKELMEKNYYDVLMDN